jgi:hypothetical protein
MKHYFLIISFISFLLFIKLSSGCDLCQGTWYKYCTTKSDYSGCDLNYPVQAYDFCVSFFYHGCRMGFAADQLYWCPCAHGICSCSRAEAKWYTSPSYNGQPCKVECGIGCEKKIEGKWDLSDEKCVTLCSTNFIEAEYVTESGIELAGDFKCESACGADPRCDEKRIYDACGINGRCTDNCQCCETYDTDGGKNYLVKGTTQALSSDGSSCFSAYDDCVFSPILIEYYVEEIGTILAFEIYNCSERTDGNIRCVDGHCGCLTDSDCKSFDPNSYCDDTTNTCKSICSEPCNSDDDCKGSLETACCKNGLAAYCNPNTKTCDCFTSCKANDECQSGYCCLYSISRDLPKECVPRWNIASYQGKSYLCDPPNWINEENSNSKNLVEIIIEKLNLYSNLYLSLFPILNK